MLMGASGGVVKAPCILEKKYLRDVECEPVSDVVSGTALCISFERTCEDLKLSLS